MHVSLSWSSDNKSAVVDEGNHRIRIGTAGFSSRRAVVNSSSLRSQHGGWKRRSPVNSPSKESKTPLSIDYQSTGCLRQSWALSWVCIRGTLSVNPPDTSPTCSPLLLEVAPSILQNALRLASQLLQLAPFHNLASQPLTAHSMLLFSDPAITLCLTFALESQTNGRSQTFWCSVWLSRTLGHAHWVCCKVIQVAPVHTGSSLSTFWSPATRQLYKTPFIDRFQCLFCFGFGLMLIRHTCLFSQLFDSLSVFLSLLAMHLG